MPRDPLSVLGIDAAWTENAPSGVALVQKNASGWYCVALAPSYASFGSTVIWDASVSGGGPQFDQLAAASKKLLDGSLPSVVAVDMPLSLEDITCRRSADSLVSRRFGHAKCSTHSPSATRPGPVSKTLRDQCQDQHFSLMTTAALDHDSDLILMEVYPHVALLGLMGVQERVPYKASKAIKYWPHRSAADRRRLLVDAWAAILAGLGTRIAGIDLPLPTDPELPLTYLKRFEDALDALICAWVGIEFLEGRALPLGDETAAIWVPQSSIVYAKELRAA